VIVNVLYLKEGLIFGDSILNPSNQNRPKKRQNMCPKLSSRPLPWIVTSCVEIIQARRGTRTSMVIMPIQMFALITLIKNHGFFFGLGT